jgi:hypothetical protein
MTSHPAVRVACWPLVWPHSILNDLLARKPDGLPAARLDERSATLLDGKTASKPSLRQSSLPDSLQSGRLDI